MVFDSRQPFDVDIPKSDTVFAMLDGKHAADAVDGGFVGDHAYCLASWTIVFCIDQRDGGQLGKIVTRRRSVDAFDDGRADVVDAASKCRAVRVAGGHCRQR